MRTATVPFEIDRGHYDKRRHNLISLGLLGMCLPVLLHNIVKYFVLALSAPQGGCKTEAMQHADIGASCAKCNAQDFLPFVCHGCGKEFCKDHMSLSQHSCPRLTAATSATAAASAMGQPCAKAGCPETSITLTTCLQCRAKFCVPYGNSHQPLRRCGIVLADFGAGIDIRKTTIALCFINPKKSLCQMLSVAQMPSNSA